MKAFFSVSNPAIRSKAQNGFLRRIFTRDTTHYTAGRDWKTIRNIVVEARDRNKYQLDHIPPQRDSYSLFPAI